MADNVSPETPASETAELSIDEVASRRAQAEPDEPQVDEQEPPADDEPAKTEEANAEETTEGEESAAEEDARPEAKDDVLIKLDDGSTISVAELKAKAVTLETENARILQEATNERREVQQYGQNLSETFDAVVKFLEAKLPPQPDDSLLWSDPTRHHQMTYLRNAAIGELQSLLQVKQSVDGSNAQISEADVKAYQAAEKAKLVKAVPNLKDESRYKAAMDKTKAYLASVGFDKELIESTHDAKMLQVAMDAAYGREARDNAAKAKAQVKTVTGQKPVPARTVHPNSLKALNVNNAAKRAQSTGSIEDILAMRLARGT